jgi:Tfp pilus assembly protein PilP
MMPKLRLRITFTALVAALMCAAVPLQAATSAPTGEKDRIELDVTRTNATAFLVTLAGITNTAVIVDGYFADRRIDLVGRYDNAGAVFEAAAKQLGANLLTEQGAYLLSHPCTPKARSTLPSNAALRNTLTVNIESLDRPSVTIKEFAKELGEYVVQWRSEVNALNPSNAPEISGAIGIYLRDAELKKTLELMSYVAGYTLTATADRRLELQALPRSPDCVKPPTSIVKKVIWTPVSRKSDERGMEYLESFPIQKMRLTGRVTAGGATFALVQLDHGVVVRVKVGNYIGENHGRVQVISPDGVTVKEILENAEGHWYERDRFVPYHTSIDDSSVKPVPAALAAQLREDARSYVAKEEFAKAIQAATKAIELDPENVIGYLRRASARSFNKDHAGAIKDADRMVALDKDSAITYALRAEFKQSAGQIKSAIDDLAKAINLEADPAEREEFKRRQTELVKSQRE